MSSGFPPQPAESGSNYAGIGARIGAHIIDGLLVIAASLPGFILLCVLFLAGFAVTGSSESSQNTAGGLALTGLFLGWALAIIGSIGFFIYNIRLLGRDGATMGKRWMHIKDTNQVGEPIGFGKAFLREIIKIAIGSACFIL